MKLFSMHLYINIHPSLPRNVIAQNSTYVTCTPLLQYVTPCPPEIDAIDNTVFTLIEETWAVFPKADLQVMY